MRCIQKVLVLPLFAFVLVSSARGQVEHPAELTYPPLPAFVVPTPTRVELDNGLVVILLEDHELPLVDAVARIRTGSRLEPADKIGLAALTGAVMRTGGTATMSGDEIDDYLENRAASVEASIGVDSGTASMSALVADLPDVFDVFADVLRHPVFAEDRIEVAMAQARTAVARQNDNPQGILFRELGEVVYGDGSPYARSPTYATLAAIERRDLLDWHARFYHPNNVVLGMVGDFDSAEMVALVRRVFGDWARGPDAPEGVGDWNLEPAPGVFFVPKSDVTQSNIALGHLGIRRDADDFYAVQVLNELFSGGFASRLVSVVRTQKGLAYAVSGSVGSDWDHPGVTRLWMSTKVENTGAGIEALLEEARRLTSEPPSAEEVAKAKQRILASFVFNSDSTRDILGQQLTYEYYGYPLDWLDRYAEGIDSVSLEEARRSASERIHPDRFSIVVVGPTEGMDKPLSEFGPVTTVDIAVSPPPVTEVVATEASAQAGVERMDRLLAALGGAGAVARVESIVQRGKMSASTPQGAMEAGFESIAVYPDRFKQEMALPFGTLVTVVSGETGFQTTPDGTRSLDGERLADSRRARGRNLLVLLRRYLDGQVRALARGEHDVALQAGDETIVLSLDPATGQIATMTYQGNDFAGTPGQVVLSFDDRREVSGLELPFTVIATFEGGPLWSLSLDAIELGANLPAGTFERPAVDAFSGGSDDGGPQPAEQEEGQGDESQKEKKRGHGEAGDEDDTEQNELQNQPEQHEG
jgi:predicted Zn-dependent peptidase